MTPSMAMMMAARTTTPVATAARTTAARADEARRKSAEMRGGIMRRIVSMVMVSATALSLAGCDGDDGESNGGAAGGVDRGTYEVPTVCAELASAAVYDVPEVEWRVGDGTAELSYDLPLGLVGEAIRVRFSGPVGASGAAAALGGEPGTAKCEVSR